MSVGADEREKFAAFLLRIRASGLTSRELVSVIESVPRRSFIPSHWQAEAWSDRTVPIACGEAIEGIDLQAKVIAALELQPSHRVLEIGTGSGYTAAVMSRLAARVLTVDRYKTLVADARQRFETLELANVIVRQADGANGLAADGPFDRIVVWAAYETLPRFFVEQLSTGGIAIAPIGPGEGEQVLAKLTKLGSRFEREDIATVRFQPLAAGVAQAI
jgi:protein-L-isoaspartate(D-aspartate) O-methyltransferase